MKAYICSFDEPTTAMCCKQLIRFGYEPVLLDQKISWYEKYKWFIFNVNEPCIRIDADIIPNKSVRKLAAFEFSPNWLVKCNGYDLYKNDVGVIGCNFYSVKGIEEIRAHWDKVDPRRPEATAWRIPHINPHTALAPFVVGCHGLGQNEEGIKRAFNNKNSRGQMEDYDFEIVEYLQKIKL